MLLPPAVQKPLQELALFKSRNVSPSIKPGERRKYLSSVVLPDPHQSATFGPRLLKIEQDLGTIQATLIGLLVTSPIISVDDLAAGLEHFDQIVEAATKQDEQYWFWRLPRLYKHFAKKLVFDMEYGNFRLGLDNFHKNIMENSDSNIVGNCIVGDALFTLLAQSLGFAAEVGTFMDEMHVFTHFWKGNRFFDIGGDKFWFGDFRLSRFRPSQQHVLGSTFLFISALLLAKISEGITFDVRQTDKKYWPTKDRAQERLEMLATAEAINPFSAHLYRYRSIYYSVLEQPELAEANERYSEALKQVAQEKGPLSLMLAIS